MWKRIVLLTLFVIAACFAFFGRQMVLIPMEQVRIVADITSLNSLDPAKTLAVIPQGQYVRVTGCRNFVDDQVYRVKTETGVEGYVAGGRFKIERKSLWDPLGGRIVICF